MQKVILAACSSLFLLAPSAFAHIGAASLEKEVGEYLVDIGVDPEVMMEGQDTYFSIMLLGGSGKSHTDFAPYDRIDVQITGRSDNPLLEKTITLEEPSVAFVQFLFPEKGTYAISTHFFQGDTELASAEFPLQVVESPEVIARRQLVQRGAAFVLAIIICSAGLWFVVRHILTQ